jgi:hypothetical protein
VGKVLIVVESKELRVPPADKQAKSMPLPFTVQPGPQQHDIGLK